MKAYPHVVARVFDRPLMIAPAKAELIARVLEPRLGLAAVVVGSDPVPASGPHSLAAIPGAAVPRGKAYALTDRGIAVIPVSGTLVHAAAGLEPPSIFTSYGEIEATFRDAVADGSVRAVLFDLDSFGGEVNGAFDLADVVYGARGVKPVWAVADEAALSAAYALASSASRVVLPRTGAVGSVGVIALHLDVSDRDRAEGLRYTAVHAGARKNDFSPHERLTEEARDILQESVDRVHGLFVATVARNRRMEARRVAATEAAVFEGGDAVAAGFADAVLPFREALAELTESLDRPRSGFVLAAAPFGRAPASAAAVPLQPEAVAAVERSEKEISMNDTSDARPASAEASAGPGAPAGAKGGEVSNVVDIAEARGQGYAQALEVVELCRLADLPEMAAELLQSKATPAEARTKLQAARAEAQARTPVISAIRAGAGTRAVGEAPVVAACKRLAEQALGRRAATRG